MAANLASHFGSWTAMPVVSYTAGVLKQYTATIYIGSSYGEPVPAAFLDDVFGTTKPVIWAYDNLWQLTARYPNFFATYGWIWSGFDNSSVAEIDYPLPPSSRPTQKLTRYATNGAGIMNYFPVSSAVMVLGNCVRSDGTSFPWALRSPGLNGGSLTYIGENPLVYVTEGDRYLAFCDLLFDALAPATPTQHRALVRLEDIDPTYDPARLRQIADYLARRGVPFGFHIVPLYVDALGYRNNGIPQSIALSSRPELINAIRYMQSQGGAMICHGWTHQYDSVANPYTGASGDCEFYRITENADHTLNYRGPVAEDSTDWAQGRFDAAASELAASGLTIPDLVTFPSYAASVGDYGVAQARFSARAERSLYFTGLLSGDAVDYTRFAGQYFPYPVLDLYNSEVLPDTLGVISPQGYHQIPPRLPAQIIADAQRNLAVRDGWASFFYNPRDDIGFLQTTVEGLQNLGYVFVDPSSI
jgi:uncharacterized protein YdaL